MYFQHLSPSVRIFKLYYVKTALNISFRVGKTERRGGKKLFFACPWTESACKLKCAEDFWGSPSFTFYCLA